MRLQLPGGGGWIVALLVIVACFVLWLTHALPPQLALLIGGCALARLLP